MARRPDLHWGTTLFLLGTPIIAFAGIPWYIAANGLAAVEAVTFLALWLAIGIAVTAGYHRLFAHRSYETAAPIRILFLVLGAAAIQTSALKWAYKHRIHHADVDGPTDPYSIRRGFWWAHMGWVLFSDTSSIEEKTVRDLLRDPLVRWQDRYYHVIAIAVAGGIPLVVGLLSGHVLGCLLIGCIGRIVATHHVTFFINSLCHMIGTRRYSLEHSGRDSSVMALLAFGEGYHNYHHTFPYDYRNGIRSWHVDPAKWIIAMLAKLHLAHGLKRTTAYAVAGARSRVQYTHSIRRLDRVPPKLRPSAERRLRDAYDAIRRAVERGHAFERAVRHGTFGREGMHERAEALRGAFARAQRRWTLTLRWLKTVPRVASVAVR